MSPFNKIVFRGLIAGIAALLCYSCGSDQSSNIVDQKWANEIKKGVPSKSNEEALPTGEKDVKVVSIDAKESETEAKLPGSDVIKPEVDAEPEPKIAKVEKKVPAGSERKKERKKSKSKRVATIEFKNSTHKYGSIAQGDEIKHKFYFKNTGTKELVISNATASCGCTQPSYPFIPIAPGEEGFIGVTFNSTGKLGPQKPSITITTNAEPKIHKLYLDGFVDAKKEDDQKPKEENKEEKTG